METWKGWRKIRYEAELEPHFASEIASIPGGEKLYDCIQCGTCSGMCPLTPYMDYTPRQIIAMIRAGFKGEVLKSYTTWLCASCYACSVECPREIKITDIMYAAKRLAIRDRVHPKRFPPSVLAGEFFRGVEKNGRSSEGRLLVRLFMKTNPFMLLKKSILGLRLMQKGRFSLKNEAVKQKGSLHDILKVIEREHMVKSKEELLASGEVHK